MLNRPVTPVIVDIETVPHPNAAEWIPAPDLEAVKAPGNYKDEDKIAAYVEGKRRDLMAEWEANIREKAALDPYTCQIVAIAWAAEEYGEDIQVVLCPDEDAERSALEQFWRVVSLEEVYGKQHRLLIGFCIGIFDLSVLTARSSLLGVSYPDIDERPWGTSFRDVRDKLCFGMRRSDNALMPRSLKWFAKRFEIPVEDEIDGKDIWALAQVGDWEAIRRHAMSDVALTQQLAWKLNMIVPRKVVNSLTIGQSRTYYSKEATERT